jgi:hypothetical protein
MKTALQISMIAASIALVAGVTAGAIRADRPAALALGGR